MKTGASPWAEHGESLVQLSLSFSLIWDTVKQSRIVELGGDRADYALKATVRGAVEMVGRVPRLGIAA